MTTPYNQIDHTHCWEKKNPPCGQKIEHLKCCLCENLNPKVVDRAALHTSLVAAVKEKAYKPWSYLNDCPGEVEMIKLEDLLTIINSIFKE